MAENRNETINYKYFQIDQNYKRKSRLLDYWEQMQDFYEGNQVPENQPKGLPTFVANLCSYLINTKASKLRGTPYSIVFQSANNKATDKLDKFDQFVLLDLKYDIAQQQSIINMLIYGTEVVMYRFSNFGVSLDAVYEGKLVREHIDLRRFAVANPYLPSLQEQKWIMIWNYHDVQSVREMCRKMDGETDKDFEERKASIVPDDYTNEKYPRPEDISHGVVCVYTRYFRINGEVCYQSSTQSVDLFEPTFLNPSVQKEKIKKALKKDNKVGEDYDIDGEPTRIEAHKEKMSKTEYSTKLKKFSLYPFADFTPNRRFNHYYGTSDIQDVVAAQKTINFLYEMATKNIQDNAWGKWLAKAGALRGQTINNDGGQVLIDYSKDPATFGIQRMERNSGAEINVTQYITNIVDLIRTLKGATEVISGDNASSLSGYAISLLQEQGNTVFEMIQSVLWNDFAIQEAKIRLQFYFHYYKNKQKFIYELSDVEYEEETRNRELVMENALRRYNENPIGQPPTLNDFPRVNRVQEDEFSSKDIEDDMFYIVPKAGRSIKYSGVVQADQINQLFKDGTIANLSVSDKRAYIELNPLIDATTKAKFKQVLDQQEESQNAQLVSQVKDLTSQLTQSQELIARLQNSLKMASDYNKSLKTEFNSKLSAAREQNKIYQTANERMYRASQNSENTSTVSDEIISEGVNAAVR